MHLYWLYFHGCRWPIRSLNFLTGWTLGYLLIPSVTAHCVKPAGAVFGQCHTDQLLLPLGSSIPVSYKRLLLQEPRHLHSRLALCRPLHSLLQRRTVCHEAVHPNALPGPGCDIGSWVSVGPADARHLQLQLNPLKVIGNIIFYVVFFFPSTTSNSHASGEFMGKQWNDVVFYPILQTS